MPNMRRRSYCVNLFCSTTDAHHHESVELSSFRALHEALLGCFDERADTDSQTLRAHADAHRNGDLGSAKRDLRKGLPLFNLALPRAGAKGRKLSDYEGHSAAVVLDIDEATDRGFLALLERLRAVGWTHFYYASHSCASPAARLDDWRTATGQHGAEERDPESLAVHEGPTVRYRVLIELDRPLALGAQGLNEYRQIHAAIVGFASSYLASEYRNQGCIVDHASQNLSQLYYVPAGAAWKRSELAQSYFEGAPAEVDLILREFQAHEPKRAQITSYPEMCATDPVDRITKHRKGFKKLARSYYAETLELIAAAPKTRGTVMYPIKNDRSFAIGGFAASGALTLVGRPTDPVGNILNSLVRAHTMRLAGWADDLIESTAEVVKKAFLEGTERPLYESEMHASGVSAQVREAVALGQIEEEVPPPLPGIGKLSTLKLFLNEADITAQFFYKWMLSDDNRGDGVLRYGGGGSWYHIAPLRGDTYWRCHRSAVGNSHAHFTFADDGMYYRFCQKVGGRVDAYRDFLIAKGFAALKEPPSMEAVRLILDAMHNMEGWPEDPADALYKNGAGVMRCMMGMSPMQPTDAEATKYKLPIKNGVLDLRTLELQQADPEDYLIGGLGHVSFDPDARCPVFDRYLAESHPEPEMREFMLRLMGYNLLNSNPLQQIFLHVGSGANGKSAWGNITRALMGGDLVGTPSSEIITASRKDAHPELYGQLTGLRVAFLSETSNGAAIDENQLKRLTGEEHLHLRRMRENYMDVPITFKLHVLTNNLPAVYSDSHGTWRRLVVVPWAHRIAPEDQNKNLTQDVARELNGVFCKVAQAARQVIEDLESRHPNPLRIPDQCRAATASYKRDYDRAEDFLQHCTNRSRKELYSIQDPEVREAVDMEDEGTRVAFRIHTDELWKKYKRYARVFDNESAKNAYREPGQLVAALQEKGFDAVGRTVSGLCTEEVYAVLKKNNTDLN